MSRILGTYQGGPPFFSESQCFLAQNNVNPILQPLSARSGIRAAYPVRAGAAGGHVRSPPSSENRNASSAEYPRYSTARHRETPAFSTV
ncbi:hypothetical protein GAG84_26195 [Bacteroides thetaiotaomicron]|nr:hypothetical protein GAG84_26195 [Bacteroides thetaiotaomicron]